MGSSHKKVERITFPIDGLDLSAYVGSKSAGRKSVYCRPCTLAAAPAAAATDADAGAGGASAAATPRDAAGAPRLPTYSLYAACNHHGTMHSGHYTAAAKIPLGRVGRCQKKKPQKSSWI